MSGTVFVTYHELVERGAKIKVAVLCPGVASTRIMESERSRPDHLMVAARAEGARWDLLRQAVRVGMPQVTDAVFQAIRDERFYILTHPETREMVRMRMENILHDRCPTVPKV